MLGLEAGQQLASQAIAVVVHKFTIGHAPGTVAAQIASYRCESGMALSVNPRSAVTYRIRIRRFGVRIPTGAQQFSQVTRGISPDGPPRSVPLSHYASHYRGLGALEPGAGPVALWADEHAKPLSASFRGAAADARTGSTSPPAWGGNPT